MPSGSPPSSRPYLVQDPEISGARGTLRDGLGGLKNLDQLLKSIRVGPKALIRVLPDVYASCAPMQDAAHKLLQSVASRLPQETAPELLMAFIQPRLRELASALEKAQKTTMNAKTRLSLGQTVSRVSADLEAAHALLDLFEETLWAPALRVGFLDLLRESFYQPSVGVDDQQREVIITGFSDRLDIMTKPRSMIGISQYLMSQVTEKSERASLAIDPGSHALSFRCEPVASQGYSIRFSRQYIIEPTLACIEAIVRMLGGNLERLEEHAFNVTCDAPDCRLIVGAA